MYSTLEHKRRRFTKQTSLLIAHMVLTVLQTTELHA
jgi:hypothetical protein